MGFDPTHDMFGNLVPAGPTVRWKNWEIYDDTGLPAHLEATGTGGAITVTGIDQATSRGECRILQTADGPSGIASKILVDINQFHELAVFVDDLYFTGGINLQAWRMGVYDDNEGFGLYSEANKLELFVRHEGVDTTLDTNLRNILNAGAAGRKCIGIRWRPYPGRLIYTVNTDDQIAAMTDQIADELKPDGRVPFRVEFSRVSGDASYSARFSGIRFSYTTG